MKCDSISAYGLAFLQLNPARWQAMLEPIAEHVDEMRLSTQHAASLGYAEGLRECGGKG